MKSIRTFIAVEITDAVRKRVRDLVKLLDVSDADVRWADPGTMHLTLKFLGDVPITETAAVCSALSNAVKSFQPFDLECRGAGAFPDASRPRTLWVGVGDGQEEMTQLHETIEEALWPLRFARDSRYRPHLTIGRIRRAGPEQQALSELINEHADFEAGTVAVDEVLVYSSHLEKSGPIHQIVGRAELA